MKFSFIFILFFIFAGISTVNAASIYDDYMEGHPINNEKYYNLSYNNRSYTPNYDSEYYNKTYKYNNNYDNNTNNAPQGNDIGDYNPYFDSDGNLKN